MALQGTIETFALPEVLRLLGSGGKTGRLRVSGDRGSGSVWIDGGKVVGAEATGARDGATAVSVVFELLRFAEGSFNFDDDQTNTDPTTPQDVEVLLGDAERHLSEWQEIEAVVPSLDVGLTFVAELPSAEVAIDSKRWKALVAVADGRSVRSIAEALDLDEFDACRRAKELVEAGLVEVTELVVEPIVPEVADVEIAPEAPVVEDAVPSGDLWTAGSEETADEAPIAFELAAAGDFDAAAAMPAAEPELTYDTGFAPGSGFAAEPAVETPYDAPFEASYDATPEPRSAARAELDAMASGFGLQDEAPAYGGFSSADASTDGNFASGDFAASGDFGGSSFDQGFGSDPSEDPAFSFAAPGAGAENDFEAFGAPADTNGADAGGSIGSGAALFADDVVTSAPPASGLNGSDGLFAPGTSGFDGQDDSGDAAEVARQLANLSPKAARAVAAAARASTVEDREAALAEVTSEGDEPINRGLLLKFLSSVQT